MYWTVVFISRLYDGRYFSVIASSILLHESITARKLRVVSTNTPIQRVLILTPAEPRHGITHPVIIDADAATLAWVKNMP